MLKPSGAVPPAAELGTALRMSVVGVIVVLVIGYYAWAVAPEGKLFGHFNGKDTYYNLLVKGFRSGHLSLAVETPPGVLKLLNPYDPQQNAPFGMHDVSYYKGKFYLYFGAAPAVVLYWPFLALTGRYLEDAQALFILSSVGFLAAAALVCTIRRTYFPGLGVAAEAAGVLAVGFTNMVPVLLRRQQIYELAVGGANGFFMVSLLCLFLGLHGNRRNLWLAGASLAYGLAIASRPTYIFGGVILLLPIWAAWLDWRQDSKGSTFGARVASSLLPAGLVGLGLMAYNFGRFESPLEFGQRLAFSGADETRVTHFSLSYIWFNCRAYLFAPAQLSSYFPFVRVIWLPQGPPGHYGIEDPYGIFPNIPFTILAVLAPLACWGRPRLGLFVTAAAAASFLTACVIFSFQFATNRYMVDFLPGFVVLAVIGLWAGLDRLDFSVRRWAGAGAGLLLAWSVLFNLFASFNHNELLRVNNPEVFKRLIHFFDEPRFLADKISGRAYGPTEINLTFPTGRTGKLEPILITGSEFLSDYLYVYYVSDTQIEVGFEHSGFGGPVSAPITLDFGKPHQFLVDMPSLYPPIGDPYFDGIPKRAVEAFSGHLRVMLDGVPIVDGPQLVFPAFRERPLVGTSAPGQTSLGERFTGQITSIKVLKADWSKLAKADLSGPIVVSLVFPTQVPGAHEPLLTSGKPGSGDVLVVNYLDATHVTLTLDHWGYGGPTSAPFEIKPGTRQTMRISFGSFFPESERPDGVDPSLWSDARHRLKVTLDAATVFNVSTPFYDAPAATVAVGRNSIGASSSVAEFSGKILGYYRVPLE